MKYLLALASLTPALGYLITEEGVKCREGPNLGFPVVKAFANGTDVTLVCQTLGSPVFGDSIWGKTTDGCYVSNYYTATGSKDFVVEECGGSGGEDGGDGGEIVQPSRCTFCRGINSAGMRELKEFEGFVPDVYPDPIGLPTVGYGHLCQTPNCTEVPYPFPLSLANGTRLLNDDLPTYTTCLGNNLNENVTLNENQWAALASFTYNLGCGQTTDADFFTMINNGTDVNTAIAQEFPLFVYAGGQKLEGLVRRRAAEVKLALTPSNKTAFPFCE